MRDLVTDDRVQAHYMPDLGIGIVEMVLGDSILVRFETSNGPYRDAFNPAELEIAAPENVSA